MIALDQTKAKNDAFHLSVKQAQVVATTDQINDEVTSQALNSMRLASKGDQTNKALFHIVQYDATFQNVGLDI